MRRLIHKLKGGKDGSKSSSRAGGHYGESPDTYRDDVSDSKFTVLGPVPSPQPPPDQKVPPRPDVITEEEVGTFAGFDSWMASFQPNPHDHAVVEVAAQPVRPRPDIAEVLSLEEGYSKEDLLSLILCNLKKPGHASTFTVMVVGPWFMTLSQMNSLLHNHGYEKIVSAKHATQALSNWDSDRATPVDFQIPVIDGPSNYDADSGSGLLINRDEPIGAFIHQLRRLRISCKDGKVVATSFPAELEMGFNRTLRLPEDGNIHHQPVRLGTISVNNIAGIANKLDSSRNKSLVDMARKGGVFFPLYQREAMFLSFTAKRDIFAVRVFVGGVNAVSGLPWNSHPSQRVAVQDYLSVPPQQYLDGVSVGRDIVKQFIAMPLGSGYSVEKQVTGKEDVGGMQLEIIPGNQWVLQMCDSPHYLDPRYTPRTLNVDMMVLAKQDMRGLTEDSKQDTVAADDQAWLQEHRPVYIRHLYQSQTVYPQAPRGQEPSPPAFHAGTTVQMEAVYMLKINLSYEENGLRQMTTVEWAPWWSLEKCYAERRRVSFKINGRYIEDLELYHQSRRLHVGKETLQQQGVVDQGIISIEAPRPPQIYQQGIPYPNHSCSGLSSQHYSSSQNQYQYPGGLQQEAPYPSYDHMPSPAATSYQTYSQQPSYSAPQQSHSASQEAWTASSSQQSTSPSPYASPNYTSNYSFSQQETSSLPHSAPYSKVSELSSSSSPTEAITYQQSYDPDAIPSSADPRPNDTPTLSSVSTLSPAGVSAASPTSTAPTHYSPQSQPRPAVYNYGRPAPGMAAQQSTAADVRPCPPSAAPSSSAAPSPGAAPGAYYSSQFLQQQASISHGSPRPVSMAPPSSAAPSPLSTPGAYYSSQAPQQDALTSYGRTHPGAAAAPSFAPIPSPRREPQDQTGWAMGIAAGSRIRQAILRDPFSRTAWCAARATILSVQILNSVAFEALTGMMAPSSPITPQMYLDQGLPFLASYDEGGATDGEKNLAGLKGVGEIDAMDGIQLGVNVASSKNVGCTCCGKMLCDSILRPCNHAFCSNCVYSYMTYGTAVVCRICNARATRLVGFSAPMALPGEDRVDLRGANVVTIEPHKGSLGFHSIHELDAAPEPPHWNGAPSQYELE